MGFHQNYLPKMFWLLSAGHVIGDPVLPYLFTICSLICFLKYPYHPLLTWNLPSPHFQTHMWRMYNHIAFSLTTAPLKILPMPHLPAINTKTFPSFWGRSHYKLHKNCLLSVQNWSQRFPHS